MTRRRLFHKDLAEGPTTLSPDESHHFATVLRGHRGEEVSLFDGEGREAGATVTGVDRGRVTVVVGPVVHRPFGGRVRLTLATALPRLHRQRFLFEKCTELGVWAIWPTVCERSVVVPRGGQVAKWQRIAVEAAKQCGRNWLPRIEGPWVFANTVSRASEFDVCLVTDVGTQDRALAEAIRGLACGPAPGRGGDRSCHLLVWIGPEGGLSADEMETALAVGALRAGLGEFVLRVETAALAVATLVSQLT